MNYVREVDFNAYERRGYEAQHLYRGERAIVIGSNVPVGAAAPPHHVHPVDQLYYIVEGEMQLQLGSDRHVAGPDTLVYIPAGTPHHNWNEGDVDEFHFEVLAPMPPPNVELMTPTESTELPEQHYRITPLVAGAYEDTLPGFGIQRLLQRSDGSEHLSLYVATVDPGSGGPATHVHEFDQFYYVLEGVMSLQIGLDRYTAGPHSLAILPAGVPHAQWNEGAHIERHITLIAPEPEPGDEPWDVGVVLTASGVVH